MGGIGVIFKKTISMTEQWIIQPKSFEIFDVQIKCGTSNLRLVVIYRRHYNTELGITPKLFVEEFGDLLDQLALHNGRFLLLGDFNFHWNKPHEHDTKVLLDIFKQYGLIQHVDSATHWRGNIIDFLVTREDENLIRSVSVTEQISDHLMVDFTLTLDKPPRPLKSVTFCKIRDIVRSSYVQDIQSSGLLDVIDIDTLVSGYNDTIRSLTDRHAPEKTRVFVERPRLPYYTAEVDQAKRLRRQFEEKWRTSATPEANELFKSAKLQFQSLFAKAEESYYNSKVQECGDDARAIFRIVNNLLHKKGSVLPTCDSISNLAQDFSDFFITKVAKIQKELVEIRDNSSAFMLGELESPCTAIMDEFRPIAQTEVKSLIAKSGNASCDLDPIPTPLLKECQDTLLPVLTNIINCSLTSGEFPASEKLALVKPLIKKSFLHKLIEKAVATQLVNHLDTNRISESMQSAYRAQHSTESALARVQHDLLMAIDGKKAVLMVLLDLSAAFDVIDHDVLLKRLEVTCGLKGTVLKWMESYLRGRSQKVYFGRDSSSDPVSLSYALPQGSGLGPIKFAIYVIPLGKIIRRYEIDYHMYADDNQIYLAFHLGDKGISIAKVEKCVAEIRVWMRNNMLKLNDDKTEVVMFSSPHHKACLKNQVLNIGSVQISPAPGARNLGVQMDQLLNMRDQVNSICRSSYIQLCYLWSIQKKMTPESLVKVVHAFITS